MTIRMVIADELAVPEGSYLWADPISFDLPILEHLFERVGVAKSWDRRQTMCGRTLRKMSGYDRDSAGVENKLEHDAEMDARVQAVHIMNCMRSLRE